MAVTPAAKQAVDAQRALINMVLGLTAIAIFLLACTNIASLVQEFAPAGRQLSSPCAPAPGPAPRWIVAA